MTKKVNNLIYGLPEEVSFHRAVEHDSCTELFISVKEPKERVCPHCGSHACVIKDSGRKQTVRHTHVGHQAVILTFPRRRYYCKDCRSTFMQPISWLHPSLRMTHTLYFEICYSLMKPLSIKSVAEINCVTESVVQSVLDTISFPRPDHLPSTLIVDELKADCGEWNPVTHKWDKWRFVTNLTDGDGHFVIDILHATNLSDLAKYFRKYSAYERQRVKYFCCDMSGSYIALGKKLFPKAAICIDMFHVIQRLNKAVDDMHRRLQNQQKKSDNDEAYSTLKHISYDLRARKSQQFKLWKEDTSRRLKRLEDAFREFPDLAEVYEMLQDFHDINDCSGYDAQFEELIPWLQRYLDSPVEEVASAAATIDRYKKHIMNSWKYHHSSGTCEGLNNRIKAMKRASFGVHSFDVFRKRILLACGSTKIVTGTFTIYDKKSHSTAISVKGGDSHDPR